MTQNRIRLGLVGGVVALVVMAGVSTRLAADVTSDCVGKPYGYPGCPTRSTARSSAASAPMSCGNAVVDAGEQCDKGRFNGYSDCSTECTALYCGDGVITPQAGEECEPQTEEVYVQDPQTGDLVTEVRFKSTGGQCGSYCAPPSCDASGQCSGGCRWAFVYQCSSSSSVAAVTAGSSSSAAVSQTPVTQSSSESAPVSSAAAVITSSAGVGPTLFTSVPVCGNGTLEAGEECDDSNRIDTDNCTNLCRSPRCGDGLLQAYEDCDDGNRIANDNCTLTCRLASCGDGVVQIAEDCDDGNRVQNDACTNECRIPRCGDAIIQRGEDCDDGNDDDADACTALCRRARCGDGIQQSGELCDDGNRVQNDSCSNDCRLPRCGDGTVQAGEQCDSGADNSDTVSDRCRLTCRFPACGDNIIDSGEECDGGPNCNQCRTGLGGALASSSSAPTHSAALVVSARTAGMSAARTMLAGTLGAAGSLSILGAWMLRRRLAKVLRSSPKSIDDIPLDQIEMPWHKW